MLVDLGDGDDHGNASGLHMIDRFHRLRLWPIIGGDDDHDDVSHIRTARAHFSEGFMARRIEEGDLGFILHRHLIRADMLGDAAGLTLHHICATQGIKQ